MKDDFANTLLVGMLPFVLQIAEANPYITFMAGTVTIVWVTYQLISKIREDIRKRKERKNQK